MARTGPAGGGMAPRRGNRFCRRMKASIYTVPPGPLPLMVLLALLLDVIGYGIGAGASGRVASALKAISALLNDEVKDYSGAALGFCSAAFALIFLGILWVLCRAVQARRHFLKSHADAPTDAQGSRVAATASAVGTGCLDITLMVLDLLPLLGVLLGVIARSRSTS